MRTMASESNNLKVSITKIEFQRKKGFTGRFTFDDFMAVSKLDFLLFGNEKETDKRRDDIQRLYNALITVWIQAGFIKSVGHHTKKGQRGRRMVVYEPLMDLNFTTEININDS